MHDIFISYRRDGGFETAKYLYDSLTRDGYSVTFDIDTLRGGRFDEALLSRVKECTDFIVILSRGCFDRILDSSASPENDWMRRELACALESQKNIVPIMLNGFEFPQNLPSDISKVALMNGPMYSREYFDAFYQRLRDGFLRSSSSNDVLGAGTPKRRWGALNLVAVCVFLALLAAGGVLWRKGNLRHENSEAQGKHEEPGRKSTAGGNGVVSSGRGLILENGKILAGTEAEDAKKRMEQTVQAWTKAGKICEELLHEAISLRRKVTPYVQTGALATNDTEWVSACKRADGYQEWVFKHGKTPEAQIKERTAIRDGFLRLLERLEGELKKHIASARDEDMVEGTFVKRTVSRAALELASLSMDDREAAIVDFHGSVKMTSRQWYDNERSLIHDEIVDRLGREYDFAANVGNKLFKAGMHRTDEISRSRPDLVMQFYDIRRRVRNDIDVLIGQGHTEKALLYYSSAKKAFEVLHLAPLDHPDFSSVKPIGK